MILHSMFHVYASVLTLLLYTALCHPKRAQTGQRNAFTTPTELVICSKPPNLHCCFADSSAAIFNLSEIGLVKCSTEDGLDKILGGAVWLFFPSFLGSQSAGLLLYSFLDCCCTPLLDSFRKAFSENLKKDPSSPSNRMANHSIEISDVLTSALLTDQVQSHLREQQIPPWALVSEGRRAFVFFFFSWEQIRDFMVQMSCHFLRAKSCVFWGHLLTDYYEAYDTCQNFTFGA